MSDYAKAIRAIGPEHCILSSDLGRRVIHCIRMDSKRISRARELGFTLADIDRMVEDQSG